MKAFPQLLLKAITSGLIDLRVYGNIYCLIQFPSYDIVTSLACQEPGLLVRLGSIWDWDDIVPWVSMECSESFNGLFPYNFLSLSFYHVIISPNILIDFISTKIETLLPDLFVYKLQLHGTLVNSIMVFIPLFIQRMTIYEARRLHYVPVLTPPWLQAVLQLVLKSEKKVMLLPVH